MSMKRKLPTDSTPDAKKPRAITSFFASNGSATSSSSKKDGPAGPTFDKEGWVKTLTDQQKELLDLEIRTMHDSWLNELKDELVTPEFLDLKRFLKKEKEQGKVIFPIEEDIYSWSRLCPLDTVKVVILGQDPYHGPKQAHGLSFSVKPPTIAPPSLKNIYKCLKNDYPNFKPPPNNGGLLTPWAQQGVLLLNACLTVRKAEANSHSKMGWEKLTQKAIDVVATKRTRGVVFLAWGKYAADRCQKIDRKKHKVLQSVHPSPLSASRGFFDCAHFKKTNEWLETKYGINGIIDWNLGSPAATSASTSTLTSTPSKAASTAGLSDKTPTKAASKPQSKIKTKDEEQEEDELLRQLEEGDIELSQELGK